MILSGDKRKFPLVANSMQTLKHFDVHTNYLILRMANSTSFVCCVLLDGATQPEGERSCTSSLLASIYWIHRQSLVVSGAAVLF